MPRILRLNNPDGDLIGSTESIEGIREMLEPLPPGRYHIDEISADPLWLAGAQNQPMMGKLPTDGR